MIPIYNIYYMLAYASNHIQEAKLINLDAIKSNNSLELLSQVLNKNLLRLLRRGLELDYQTHNDVLKGIKGRVNFSDSLRSFCLCQGEVVCTYDDLNTNNTFNQIIRSTLTIICRQINLKVSIKKESNAIRNRMHGVTDILITKKSLNKARLISKNNHANFLISICELIYDNSIINQDHGIYSFYNFERDEAKMSRLYQDFLFQFCKRELIGIDTKRSYLKWNAVSSTDSALSFLPRMETDITLHNSGKIVHVDAKYYKKIMSKRYGVNKFNSSNIYQIMSYLYSTEAEDNVRGLLLYPQVDNPINHKYIINGYDVFIVTINLSQPWNDIHKDLLEIFNEVIN